MRALFLFIIVWMVSTGLSYADSTRVNQVKVSGYVQFWLRYTDLNDGSAISGQPINNLVDFSIRRYRVKLSKEVGDKGNIIFVLGNNNLSSTRGSNQLIELLDAYYVHQLSNSLRLGVGKVALQGALRYTAPPSSSNLTHDIPLYQLLTLNRWDQKARMFSLYGQLTKGRFKTILSVSKPILSTGLSLSNVPEFSNQQEVLVYRGYANYYLIGNESGLSPYPKATYHGKKNVAVIGLGFQRADEAMAVVSASDTLTSAITALGADFFMEYRLTENKVFTGYFAYLDSDFGIDYLRQIGANNPVTSSIPGTPGLSKAGNNVPLIGTGHTYYYQLGLMTSSWINAVDLQFYHSLQYSHFDLYHIKAMITQGGINILLNGHKSKLTLGVENRPVYDRTVNGEAQIMKRKNTVVVQYQAKF